LARWPITKRRPRCETRRTSFLSAPAFNPVNSAGSQLNCLAPTVAGIISYKPVRRISLSSCAKPSLGFRMKSIPALRIEELTSAMPTIASSNKSRTRDRDQIRNI
jgi:hypothetical protein